jgi:hypothetical protein
VFPDARSCLTCDKVLAELEKIDDDTDTFGVDFVKINDKRLAKHYGIKTFPALTYFREREPIIYEGMWLSSPVIEMYHYIAAFLPCRASCNTQTETEISVPGVLTLSKYISFSGIRNRHYVFHACTNYHLFFVVFMKTEALG